MKSSDLLQPDLSSPDPSNPWGLTANERQLLELRAQGLTYEEASQQMGYCHAHVKRLGSVLMARLHAKGSISPGVDDISGVTELFQQAYFIE